MRASANSGWSDDLHGVSKEFATYGKGQKLGEDWYEVHPGVAMFFYDEESIAREFAGFGLIEVSKIEEPLSNGSKGPFLNVICAPTG